MTSTLHQLTAGDLMSQTVHWAEPDENLRTAGVRMVEHHIRALLVPGKDPGDLPGVITSKDIVNVIGAQDPAMLDQLQVGDVATRPAICVPREVRLLDCMNLMRMAGVRRMPVLDGTKVVGILSMSDIFARLLRA
jgi:CBS domain-containing protein